MLSIVLIFLEGALIRVIVHSITVTDNFCSLDVPLRVSRNSWFSELFVGVREACWMLAISRSVSLMDC